MASTEETTGPLHEHLEALGGELDTLALLQDLYDRDDVSIPWATYINPVPEDELAGKRVLDTYREYKDGMTGHQIEELEKRIADERNRRESRQRGEE